MSEKKKRYFEIDTSRLHTTDEKGNRVYVHPEDLKGWWKSQRLKVYWFLIAVYLILPWIYWNGKQVVLLDIAGREFRFFGLTFLGHDVPYVLPFLLAGALGIAIVTVLWGRVWCGWACPQTVFLDSIFRKIETFVEGNSRKQRELDEMPWNKEKMWKRFVKWSLFTLVSTHITHSFLGYFVGTRELLEITMTSPSENMPLFTAMLFINGVILFDFGWFREQFCIIMCPYGRFQSVLMDEDSLVVAYKADRGEPRKGPEIPKEEQGDCVNCYQCVRVCPTGIDIRNGTQMECIHCTACMDACDNIMEKINKPKGLIAYSSENKLKGVEKPKRRLRLAIYCTLFLGLISVGLYALSGKDSLRLLVQRPTGNPFTVSDKLIAGSPVVTNHLRLEFYHQAEKPWELFFEVDPALAEKGMELVTPHRPFVLRRKGRNVANVFLKFPKSFLSEGSLSTFLTVQRVDPSSGELKTVMQKDIYLMGPY